MKNLIMTRNKNIKIFNIYDTYKNLAIFSYIIDNYLIKNKFNSYC